MKLRLYGLAFGLLLAIAPAACGGDDDGTVDGGGGSTADAGGGGPADAGTGEADAGGGDDASVAPTR
jgi:hypothetical protein